MYPALSEFAEDPGRTYSRWCVYMALQPPFLTFTAPRDVKIPVLRTRARISMGATSRALQWLIERGYVIVHSRDRRGMASLILAFALPDVHQLPSVNNRAG